MLFKVLQCKNIYAPFTSLISKNSSKQLLVNNAFLLYNRKPNIKKIVKNPLSTKVLGDKLLLWKYYIKDLSKEEKAHLIRKLLFYVEKFTIKSISAGKISP